MFTCRLALAMGVPPSHIEQWASRDVALLARYWNEEPWGPVRDNMHAALIAREVRRPWLKDPSKNSLDDFMIMQREARIEQQREEQTRSIFQALRGMGKRIRSSDLPARKAKKRRTRRAA